MHAHCEEIVTVHVYIIVHLFRFVKTIVHSLILVLLFSSDAHILAETMILLIIPFNIDILCAVYL